MDIFNVISAFGLSASGGLNAYIPLLVVSLLAKFIFDHAQISVGCPDFLMGDWGIDLSLHHQVSG